MSEGLIKQMRKLAARRGMGMSEFVRDAVLEEITRDALRGATSGGTASATVRHTVAGRAPK